jgi:cytoskeletal protein CcmA (bactofilin family)
MALWKEPTQNEQSEKTDEAQPTPAAVSPIPPRRESSPKDRQESVFGHHQESVFGPGVTIEGKIEGDADVRIAGKFKGDVHIKGILNIEKGAHLTAKINAETVTIGGELEGNVVANAEVKLLESGQVIGDLKAKILTVAAGSRMRGNVEFGWTDSDSAKLTSVRSQEKAKTGSGV